MLTKSRMVTHFYGYYKYLLRCYHVTPLRVVGAEVTGVDLTQPVPASTVAAIKRDVTKHRLLLFRNQDYVDGHRHVEITKWFGPVDSALVANFPRHPKAPHDAILRLSNDRQEGFPAFGTRGFHIDGSFLEKPNGYAMYQAVKASKTGATLFVPLHEVVAGLSPEKREYWERLYLVRSQGNKYEGAKQEKDNIVHPLIYKHPISGAETMCIHLGNLSHFIEDYGQSTERQLSQEESRLVVEDIEREFYMNDGQLVHEQKWLAGDFMITDNLAVAHKASPGTQTDPAKVGVRILHRCVTRGEHRPAK